MLPKVTLQFKWTPPSDEVCDSSVAKYFSEKGFEVAEVTPILQSKEELSRRIASFSDLHQMDELDDVVEHLGILALDCSQTVDEYLNQYQYSGEMVRVKNTLIVKAKGFYAPGDIQGIISSTVALMNPNIPWIAVNIQAFTRTPFCERFFEDRQDVSTECSLTFVLNSQNNSLVHQIQPIIKSFSK